MKVMCVVNKQDWGYSNAQTVDPDFGDECTVIRLFESFGHQVYELKEYPHKGGYDVRGFIPLSKTDETERLTEEDKMLQAIAENMPEEEMDPVAFTRIWQNVKATL